MANGMTKSEEFLRDRDGFVGWPGFKAEMIVPLYPPCAYCLHVTDHGLPDGTGMKCRAFPAGIPYGIRENDGENHTQHIPGDNGFLYSPRIIVHEEKQIGYYFDWEGNARDAETHKQLVFERDVR